MVCNLISGLREAVVSEDGVDIGFSRWYRISSNKRPGAYFLHGLQALAVKRDRAFIQGQALISYHLFQRYCGPMTFSDCGAPTVRGL